MLELYDMGVYFLDSLIDVGNFLLSRPLMDAIPWLESFMSSFGAILPPYMKHFWISVFSSNMAEVIFGTSLIFILTFKLAKFILDIIL